MTEQHYHFTFEVYENDTELAKDDAWLIREARRVTANAYAPYSNFLVGAAARLVGKQVVTGSNQENASFPAGICAERVLLSAAASLYPGTAIQTMAVSYNNVYGNSSLPASPCGICRQSLLEHEEKTHQPIRLLLSGLTGSVYIITSAIFLLPLAFKSGNLTKQAF